MVYQIFIAKVINWAKWKGIKTAPGYGGESIGLQYQHQVCVLLREDQWNEAVKDKRVEFRIGGEEIGFRHVANIASIPYLEMALWSFHPKILQGSLSSNK